MVTLVPTQSIPKKRVALTVIYDPSTPLDATNVEVLIDVATREPGDPADHAACLAALGEGLARLSLYWAGYWSALERETGTRARA